MQIDEMFEDKSSKTRVYSDCFSSYQIDEFERRDIFLRELIIVFCFIIETVVQIRNYRPK